MKWLDGAKIKFVLVGFVAAMGLGSGPASADFTFGTPTLFDEPVNSTGLEFFECISADGLEVYVEKPVEERIDCPVWEFYVSTRATTGDPWSVPVRLGPPVNSDHGEGFACLSRDGLELYFSSDRPGGQGGGDIWVATRPTRSDPWATAVNLGPTINTAGRDFTPWITRDGLGLYFGSDRPGGYGGGDIWVATRASTNDAWGEPTNLGPPVNSEAGEFCPCLSSDGLVLFFSDYDNLEAGMRLGGKGLSDMWMTRRKSTADPWESPVNLGKGMNTNCWDTQPRLSPDGSVLYFTSSRPDNRVWASIRDIWQAPIIPIVDFDGDGKVDGGDVCTMVDRWGTDNSICDIGPMPWGDGIVDLQNLTILAEYIGEELEDPTLVAHWAFDETEGALAADSAGANDGTVMGAPLWQPEAGQVDGALEFDGTTFVGADHVLNPSDGPFSVLAWVRSGAAGQAIISQQGGANWLMADGATGALMTELKYSPRRQDLSSQVVITDGDWHRVGFTWDGSNRRLYVDDVLVAEDTPTKLADSDGGLNIGCGKNMTPGSFFSGLIDDVRIYNRAVRP